MSNVIDVDLGGLVSSFDTKLSMYISVIIVHMVPSSKSAVSEPSS
jgi:hypothetical protein